MAKSPRQPPPKPPKNLSASARRFWIATLTDYHFETAAQLRLLEELCRALTQLEHIQKQIRADGLTSVGSRRQPVAHPLLAFEDSARRMIVQLSRALRLTDDEE